MTHYEEYQKTGDINYFEEVIDAMVLDGISGMNDSFKNAISNLSREKKRMTILSLLDKDLNLFKRIKALTDNSINKMDHIKDVIQMLREYVKVGEVEKKKYGEVMTPLDLVKEMLATLPEDVWSNPNLKWLDPANGTGPYPIMVVYKLMNGLKVWEPDDEKRYKHIIENMIYVCELQPKNMFLYMCAVDPFDTYKLNIYTGSFLEEGFDKHMKDVWNVEKFDIVMGNPPYQDGTKSQGKNSSLWTKFILKSNLTLKKNGYLLFITPFSWIAPSESQKNDLKNIFFENSLLYLNTECIKYFDVASTFSYYLIQKNGKKNNTNVNNKFNINLDLPFLPTIIKEETLSICFKLFFSKKNSLKFSSGLRNDNIIENGIYGVWYGSNLKRTNILGGNWNKKKIIVNKPGYLNARFDNGVYNSSGNNYWLEVNDENEADNLLSFFNTNFSKFILEKLCKYSGYNSLGVLKKLPEDLLSIEWTDEKLFEYFNLTEEEINLILNK
jgi:site-specific DNA-methyltransferase (adenine-specific)